MEASFLTSSAKLDQCPPETVPEIAFVGRSNVGKSSLINMLVERKGLAKTSATPGKTQLINHFVIENKWHLVDLPGYGYARVSKKDRGKFKGMIYNFLEKRTSLYNTFVLVDSRHDPQKLDLDFINWLGERGLPFSIVFTKSDKMKPLALERNVETYKAKLLESWDELPPIFITSSEKADGRDELLEYIQQMLD